MVWAQLSLYIFCKLWAYRIFKWKPILLNHECIAIQNILGRPKASGPAEDFADSCQNNCREKKPCPTVECMNQVSHCTGGIITQDRLWRWENTRTGGNRKQYDKKNADWEGRNVAVGTQCVDSAGIGSHGWLWNQWTNLSRLYRAHLSAVVFQSCSKLS